MDAGTLSWMMRVHETEVLLRSRHAEHQSQVARRIALEETLKKENDAMVSLRCC